MAAAKAAVADARSQPPASAAAASEPRLFPARDILAAPETSPSETDLLLSPNEMPFVDDQPVGDTIRL